MSRIICFLVVVWAVFSSAESACGQTSEIFKLEEQGAWGEASEAWEALVKEAPGNRMFSGRWLLALEATGRHRELDEASAKVLGRIPGWEEPLLIRCRSKVRNGAIEDAYQFLTGLTSLEAKAWRGRIRSLQGRQREAAREFAVVLKDYEALNAPGPRDHLAAGWAFRGTKKFPEAARAMESAYQDSLDYLSARLALARLFHEKYQTNLAKDELQEARRLSPNHPELFQVAAEISVQNHNYVVARSMLERAEKLAGSSRRSQLLWAHMDLVAGQMDAAGSRLSDLLDANGKDAEALTLQAAHAFMKDDLKTFQKRAAQLEAQTGSPISAYLAVADLLELAVRTQEAIDIHKQVIEMESDRAASWSSLGLLSMRMGREEEARGFLDKAFELDPYNMRAYNQLELLDFMDKFEDYVFESFTLRLLPAADSNLVSLMAEEMKEIRQEVSQRLNWEPRNRTIIEVFPSHDWFSARITGLAWIDGIPGVCFGDVLAMDSPRYLAGKLNWREILKHEFGHVVALDMTNRKVPFWFTEGLSVYLQDVPPPLSWDENLVAAAWDNRLVPIDSLTIAFTRPKTRYQRLLAYHQASLLVREIVSRFGWDVIPDMLLRFGEGKTLPQVVESELNMSWKEFQTFTADAVRREAESLRLWPRPDPARSERLSGRPKSQENEGRHLIALFTEQRLESAASTAKEILGERPNDSTANGVLGLIYAKRGNYDDARNHLELSVREGNEDFPVWFGLGSVRLSQKDTTDAREAFQKALELYSKSAEASLKLARLARAQKDPIQAGEYYRLALAADDGLPRASLEWARLGIEQEDTVQLGVALDYALGILPLDPDVYALKGQLKLLLGQDREAYALLRKARHLDLRNVEWMAGMAVYYLQQEDYEEALYFANLALKYDPKHPTALRVRGLAESEI